MVKEKLFKKVDVVTVCIAVLLCAGFTPVLATPEYVAADTLNTLSAKWSYKREINIENRGDKLSDAVIQIQFNKDEFDYTKAKADGADIRFSTTSRKLEGGGLSYWTEQWNDNGFTRIWVKIPTLTSTGKTTIYMHYGNTSAEPVSNGNMTFLFYDDFEEDDYSKKWSNVSIGEVAVQGGQLKLKETDGQDGIITANFIVTGKMIVRTYYQRGRGDGHWTRAGIGGWNNWLCVGDHTDNAASGTNYVMLFDSASITSLKSAPLAKMPNSVITDKWRRTAYWYDGNNLKGMQDDVVVEWPARNASSKLALRTLDNDSWDNFEYITVSKYLNSDPIIIIGEEKKIKF